MSENMLARPAEETVLTRKIVLGEVRSPDETTHFLIRPLLKAVQVAAVLNISRAMAYQLLQQGKIRSVRINGSVRVRPIDLERFIEQNLTPEFGGSAD